MILLTGPTGTVGTALVDELVAAGAATRAFVRDVAAAAALRDRGVEPIVGTFEDEAALRWALQGVERLFLLSPPGNLDMAATQMRISDVAAQAGVRHVVKLSSIGADEETDATIIRAHRAIEEHIEGSGMSWTHLRPHWFMQNELGQAATITADGTFYAPDVTEISLIDARDIAAAAATVLTTDGHENRSYVLTGPEALTYFDIADAYTRVLGRAVRWTEVTLDDARSSMAAAGLPPVLSNGFTEILARYQQGGTTARVSTDTEVLLGREARTFEQFLDDHRDHFAVGVRAAA